MKWLNEMTAVLNRCHSQMTPVTQFALLSYFQIFAIISIAAGIIQITETSDGQHQTTFDGDWNFFNSFFNSVLVFVTIQTPPADNVLSKVFVGILVIVLIIVVPYQISKILDIGKSYTPYELASFKPSKRAKHIILCGDLTPTRIDHFFREIFHDDHDMVDINVVVLSEEEPSTNMITLLMDPFFEKRTSYIQGSILDVDDAQRASCSKADAIFVLTRRFGQEELMASDHSTLMRVMAAKRMAPNAAIYAQMHLSNHRHLMEDLGIKNVMYFSEVMHSLLGQNCVCPGFSTFIYNLTTTSSEPMSNDTWESCYLSGSSHELYSVTLPPSEVIHGMTFAEVSSLVYSECAGVILFAIVSNTMGSKHKTLLNPGDTYTCSGGETGFVIAKNRREADAVAFLKDTVNAAAAWGTVRNISLLKEKTSKQCQQLLPYDPFSHDDSIHEDGLSLSHRPVTAANVLFSPNRPGSPIRRESKLIDWVIKPNAGLISISEDGKKNPPRVQDAIIERIEDIQDNKSTNCIAPIVVCALSPTFPDHLEYLIGPLRVKAIKIHRPIIFVCLESPTEENYETIYHFRQVYFIAGDPFRPKVLKKAGIHQAYRVVIMSGEGKMDDSGSNELLADAVSLNENYFIIHSLLTHVFLTTFSFINFLSLV
jgi:potassium large conductance calcium-activated channel subfamily M alpha protein 1